MSWYFATLKTKQLQKSIRASLYWKMIIWTTILKEISHLLYYTGWKKTKWFLILFCTLYVHPLKDCFRRNRVRRWEITVCYIWKAEKKKNPNTEDSIISTFNCHPKQNLGSKDTIWSFSRWGNRRRKALWTVAESEACESCHNLVLRLIQYFWPNFRWS